MRNAENYAYIKDGFISEVGPKDVEFEAYALDDPSMRFQDFKGNFYPDGFSSYKLSKAYFGPIIDMAKKLFKEAPRTESGALRIVIETYLEGELVDHRVILNGNTHMVDIPFGELEEFYQRRAKELAADAAYWKERKGEAKKGEAI